jgi:hypothetical protein
MFTRRIPALAVAIFAALTIVGTTVGTATAASAVAGPSHSLTVKPDMHIAPCGLPGRPACP